MSSDESLLLKRITELEAELATTKLELAVAKDSADKWFTKCRTAEAELAKSKDDLLTCQFHDRHHVTVLKECSNAIKELEAINQALTASCDDTWHCACIVPLQKRIAELEREKQMYVNSTDRLTAKVKEMGDEVTELKHTVSALRRIFLALVRTDECIEWNGSKDKYGYGRIRVAGHSVRAAASAGRTGDSCTARRGGRTVSRGRAADQRDCV